MTGRRAFRSFIRKTNPTDPRQVEQKELLGLLLGDRRGASAILEYAGGDLRNLDGLDLRDIAGIPGVGEATAARLVALFALLDQMLGQPQPATSTG